MGLIELEWLKIWNIQLLIIVGFCLVSILSLTPHFTSSSFLSLLDRRVKREENYQLKFQFPEWRGTQISPALCFSSSWSLPLIQTLCLLLSCWLLSSLPETCSLSSQSFFSLFLGVIMIHEVMIWLWTCPHI